MSELESGADRVPFQATKLGVAYDAIKSIPVSILLDNVRSLHNVGAFFRSADAAGCQKLHLCGITGHPPDRAITKTALGAEETVAWEYSSVALRTVLDLRKQGYEIAAVETSSRAVDLFDWQPNFPVCLMFGHETAGLAMGLLALCDTHVRIPMLGRKHSLNVATAGGIVIYELLRKYRRMIESATIGR